MTGEPRRGRCRGKVRYRKREAAECRNRLERQGRGPLRCYECPDCGWWHLTREPLESFTWRTAE